MTFFFDSLWSGMVATSMWEWLAFVTGILYVILAAMRHISCWAFALISSILFVYLCFTGKLYLESILQLFYVAMAIVGWISWNNSKGKGKTIHRWTTGQHLSNLIISGIVAFVVGWMFDSFTDQKAPYIDALTTVFSLAATFMVTRRVLENWLYWIVIDIFSIYLYSGRGYELLALQMLIFTVLALFGYLSWRKQLKLQQEL
ncbi:MAG: nicotinamide riboside transporter PnuC [Crocinitomicaceae bacterium]